MLHEILKQKRATANQIAIVSNSVTRESDDRESALQLKAGVEVVDKQASDISILKSEALKVAEHERKLGPLVEQAPAVRASTDRAVTAATEAQKAASAAKKKASAALSSASRDKQSIDANASDLRRYIVEQTALNSGLVVFDDTTAPIAIDVSKVDLDAGGHAESFLLRAGYMEFDNTDSLYNRTCRTLEFLPLYTQGDAGTPMVAGDPDYYAGSAPVAVGGTVTWDTTTTVLMTDTTGVTVGSAVRMDSDGQWFKVMSVTENTSVVIDNPHALSIPTGAAASSVATLPALVRGVVLLTIAFQSGTYTIGESSTLKAQVVSGDTLLGWAMAPITVTYTVVA